MIPGAMGSSAYDGDGLATREQAFVTDGVYRVMCCHYIQQIDLVAITHNAGVYVISFQRRQRVRYLSL